MKNLAVFIFFAFLGLSMVPSSHSQNQVYCGRRLASALALLCDGNLIKRSKAPYTEEASMYWPWIASQRARSIGRSKRQVVSECCDKPCSVNELLSYCGY